LGSTPDTTARSRLSAVFLAVFAAACARHDPPQPGANAQLTGADGESLAIAADGSTASYPWADAVRLARWADAARGLDALTPAEKDRPEIRYVRARVALAQADSKTAVKLLEGLDSQLPLIADDVARYRADAKLVAGPFLEAGEYFASRSTPGALLKASHAFEKAGDSARARGACDRVISNDRHTRSQEAEARARRVRLAVRTAGEDAADARWISVYAPDLAVAKEAETALARLDAAHALTTDEQMTRAHAFMEAGQTDDTLRAVDRVASSPGRAIPPLDRMRVKADALFRSHGRYLDAAKALDECAAIGGVHAAEDSLHAARALSRADHDDEAIERYAAVARRYPRSTWADEATFLAARLHFLHAHWQKAAAAFDAYAHQFPSGAERKEAARQRAIAHLMIKDDVLARKLFEQIADDEGDSLAAAQAGELGALAAFREGDRLHAIARWTEIARSKPLSWPALTARARLLEAHAPLPAIIEVADGGTAPDPLAVKLPPPVDMLHRVGLDGDAEVELREREAVVTGSAVGRTTEALCAAYGQLGRAKRRFQVAQQIPGASLGVAPGPKNRWAWECAFPAPYEEDVRAGEATSHLPEGLVYAVMRQESGYDPEVVSPARAVGLLQLLPETARSVAAEAGLPHDDAMLTSPPHNISLGARYLHSLLDKFHGQVPLAVAGYNGGPDVVARWASRMRGMEMDIFVEQIPFPETRGYVVRVMGNLARYAFLRGGEKDVTPATLALGD
jgi:soluble lytic murein transglycosylase